MPTNEQPPESTSSTVSMWRSASRFSYVGIFFGVAVIVGWLAGRYVEHHWGGAPWASLVGALLGITAGFRELYRIAKLAQRDANRADHQ